MEKEAILYLPPNGKELWTNIMQGETTVSEDIYEGQPIVMATTTFEDGIMVAGGVYKSQTPMEYNIKFFNVFDANGNLLPYRIDPSDHEDFRQHGYFFYLTDEEVGDSYYVHVKERSKKAESSTTNEKRTS